MEVAINYKNTSEISFTRALPYDQRVSVKLQLMGTVRKSLSSVLRLLIAAANKLIESMIKAFVVCNKTEYSIPDYVRVLYLHNETPTSFKLF